MMLPKSTGFPRSSPAAGSSLSLEMGCFFLRHWFGSGRWQNAVSVLSLKINAEGMAHTVSLSISAAAEVMKGLDSL